MNTTIPRDKVEVLAANFAELRALERRQKATMAEMIRACLTNIDLDVQNAHMRGHETYRQKQDQITKNKQDRAQARLYLLALATSLEDQAGSAFDISPGGPIIEAQ